MNSKLFKNRNKSKRWMSKTVSFQITYLMLTFLTFRGYKTTTNKKSKEDSAESSVAKNTDGGVKLFSKSRTFLSPEEPVEKIVKQTKPDLLAHRKVSLLNQGFLTFWYLGAIWHNSDPPHLLFNVVS